MSKNIKNLIIFFILMVSLTVILTVNCSATISSGTNTTIDKSHYAVDQVSGSYYYYGGYKINMFTTSNGGIQYGGKSYAYCIQRGSPIPSLSYTSKTSTDNPYWNNLSAMKKKGIAYASIYGFPSKTPSELYAGTVDNAYAATQVIIWEFQLGYRNLSGCTNNTLYNGYIKGTGAAIPYMNIENFISNHTKVPPYGYNTSSKANSGTPLTLVYNSSTGKYEGTFTDKTYINTYFKIKTSNGVSITYPNSKTMKLAVSSYSSSPIQLTFEHKLTTNATKQAFFILHGRTNSKNQVLSCGVPSDPKYYYVNVVTKPRTGTLTIKKTSQDGIVSGLSFNISGNGVNKTVKTGSNGQVSTTLNEGTYTVKEVNTPARYNQPASQTAVIKGSATTTKTFYNTLKTGTLTIKKTSEDGIVSGLTFNISGNGVNKNVTTNSSGQVSVTLNAGTYTVKEVNTPTRYVQPASQTAVVTAGATTTKSFYNTLIKARVKFVKKCSFYNGYLSGAVYSIYKSNGTYTGYNITSDSTNWIYSPLLPYGSYYLQEKTAPSYYAKNAVKYPFSITANGANVAVTTYDAPLADVYPTIVQPNAEYTAGTEVIVSCYIYNNSIAEWTPGKPLSVTFTAQANGVTIGTQTKSVIVPRFSNNLVYFKVSIPQGISAVTYRCTAASPAGVVEANTANNTTTKTFAVNPAVTSQTPDTEFESTPGSFLRPSDTAAVPTGGGTPVTKATWQMWAYESSGFVLKTYGAELSSAQTLTPDVNSLSHYQQGGLWHMKSGYGYSLKAVSSLTAIPYCLLPDSGAYILPQKGSAFLPEFAYSDQVNKYRTLELTAANTLEFAANPYSMTKDGEPDTRRISFTPLWYPDGKYTVKTYLTNCWTPAGMLSITKTLDPIMIEGDMYEDWYIAHDTE